MQTEKFPPFLHFFISFSPALSLTSLSLPPSPPSVCPSFIAHRKGISSSPVKLSVSAQSNTLVLSFCLSPLERSVSVKYLPVTQQSILHKNMMSISRVLSGEHCSTWYLCQKPLRSLEPTGLLTNAAWMVLISLWSKTSGSGYLVPSEDQLLWKLMLAWFEEGLQSLKIYCTWKCSNTNYWQVSIKCNVTAAFTFFMLKSEVKLNPLTSTLRNTFPSYSTCQFRVIYMLLLGLSWVWMDLFHFCNKTFYLYFCFI